MPLHRRLPKRGFSNPFRKEYRTVNVDRLNASSRRDRSLRPSPCRVRGCSGRAAGDVKILGNGELKVSLIVRAHKFTKIAAGEDHCGRWHGGDDRGRTARRPTGKFLKKSLRPASDAVAKAESDRS